MQFNRTDLDDAITQLGMCEFFPTDGATRGAVQVLLAKMVPSKEALDWLVDMMVNRAGKWKGPAELRGLLCTRFRPADGVEANCSYPGFTPEDGEQRSLENHERLKIAERQAPPLRMLTGMVQ